MYKCILSTRDAIVFLKEAKVILLKRLETVRNNYRH